MSWVYVLQSSQNGRHYIGHAADWRTRLSQHNCGEVRSTKAWRPWVVVYKEFFETKAAAYRREMQLKSYKGGEAFRRTVHG